MKEDEVLIGEDLETLGAISLPHAATYAHSLCINLHNEAVFTQITRMDEILTGYCISYQLRTIRIIVVYKNKLIVGVITIRRIPIIQCEMFSRIHFNSIRFIDLIGSYEDRVYGCGDAL